MSLLLEQDHVIMHGVSWRTFQQLLADRGERCGVLLAYDRGTVELRMPSQEHEWVKTTLTQIVEAVAFARELDGIAEQIDKDLADRKFKRPFGAAPAGAPPQHPPLAACRAPSVPRQPAGAARSEAVRGAAHFGWCWTGVSGWGRIAPQGCPGGTASGRATWEGWRGAISNGIAHAQRG